MYTHTGGGARPRKLADKMSKSLVQFMKTGDPNGAGLTPWSKYTSAKGETLVIDDVPVMKNDPDREPRRALPTTYESPSHTFSVSTLPPWQAAGRDDDTPRPASP